MYREKFMYVFVPTPNQKKKEKKSLLVKLLRCSSLEYPGMRALIILLCFKGPWNQKCDFFCE